ncbi:carbohydrate esterase family 16 protein [Neolentinus lepideus HHB14362 ss-1]|uniref:Carbohydrate esterase family 16 protein n=1 Tax=Neolentinus lepideus HHB14362 ss-1 TaxID=1314782 RepID=A0A165UN27_9AGAM|nr:carbohydrate esterase family 16 protein [Neolentinus lepideus HHB14362 ss-1]
MGETIQVTNTWPGYANLKHLVVFGDSYSDVGYNSKANHPSRDRPLGVDYPGITWAEADQPNWVGYLVTEYVFSPVLVYDYAVGGDTVAGVRRQMERHFLPTVAKKPHWAPWAAEDTLFVTWIGINDCAYNGCDDNIAELVKLQEQLYEVGARNFCFIDVPPMERSPAANRASTGNNPCKNWNSSLRTQVQAFAAAHPDATIFIFSSHRTFSRILNDPISHGFSAIDTVTPYGEIWVDRLHPTTRMHDWIAKDFSFFLDSRKPIKNAEGDTNSAAESSTQASKS